MIRGDKRPVFLDLWRIHLPFTALISILHRISGVALIASAPIVVAMQWWVFLAAQGHIQAQQWIDSLYICALGYLIVLGWWYHILAGTRHLYHDLSHDHTLQSGRVSAVIVALVWLAGLVYLVVRWQGIVYV